jgi:hypothetical protein
MQHETRRSAWSVFPKQRKALASTLPKKPNCATRNWAWMELNRSSLECEGAPCFTGAVAAQVGSRWHRIAAFSCWCKYESGDLLAGFIRIQAGPGIGKELVIRASGGGTGVYSQQQAHFRYHQGQLHLVFTFVSRHRECDPTGPEPHSCEVERRWFYVNYWNSVPGAVLVESRLKVFPETDPEPEFTSLRELELTHAQKFSCKTYKWEKEKFRYERFVAPNPCNPRTATK